MWVLNISSDEKVVSSRYNMQLAKCMPAVLWLRNYCANAIRHWWSFGCSNYSLNMKWMKNFALQYTINSYSRPPGCNGQCLCNGTRISVSIMQYTFFEYGCSWPPSTFSRGSEGSIFATFWYIRAKVWVFNCYLVGYLFQITEEQHLHFRWLGRTWSGCPPTRRSYNIFMFIAHCSCLKWGNHTCQSYELAYSAMYRSLRMLSYVIMTPHDVLYLPSKFVHGIRGHPVK